MSLNFKETLNSDLQFFAVKLSTLDIIQSIKNFITDYYHGSVRFEDCTTENRFILFGEYELARMIKSVIKELTLSKTCAISFNAEGEDFIISFIASNDSPPSEYSVNHLIAEAASFDLEIRSDGLRLDLVIPTHRFATCPIYNRNKLRFYDALISVYSE